MKKERINYSITAVMNDSCYIPFDYSHRTHPTHCLRCPFCYRFNGQNTSEGRRYPNYLETYELYLRPNLFKEPIIIGRMSDPFLEGNQTKYSLQAAEIIARNKGMFIFKTALDLPSGAVQLCSDNKNRCQVQLRFISNSTNGGELISKELAPNFNLAERQLIQGRDLISKGIDVVAIFDPFIIGANSGNLEYLIKELSEYGFKKLIVKQLFSTERFKLGFLNTRLDRRYTNILNIEAGGYWTYDNIVLLNYLYPILEECDKYKIQISCCSNKAINDLIYGKNCCQVEFG